MSRKTKTEITLQIRMQVPPGTNTAMVAEHIRAAIVNSSGIDRKNPMRRIDQEDFTLKLVKKETSYV